MLILETTKKDKYGFIIPVCNQIDKTVKEFEKDHTLLSQLFTSIGAGIKTLKDEYDEIHLSITKIDEDINSLKKNGLNELQTLNHQIDSNKEKIDKQNKELGDKLTLFNKKADDIDKIESEKKKSIKELEDKLILVKRDTLPAIDSITSKYNKINEDKIKSEEEFLKLKIHLESEVSFIEKNILEKTKAISDLKSKEDYLNSKLIPSLKEIEEKIEEGKKLISIQEKKISDNNVRYENTILTLTEQEENKKKHIEDLEWKCTKVQENLDKLSIEKNVLEARIINQAKLASFIKK